MTLQQLEYVIALDNYRHFVTAAEKCYVTQPTLTMQVKKLEDEIGVRLFDRNRKPLIPTAAGEKMIIKARQILREVEEMKAFVYNETEMLEGEYRLGIIPTISPYILPRFLPGFLTENPQTRLKITELQTDQIIDKLKNGMLDIAILSTPLNDKAIRTIPLYYEPFLLYLPDDHKLNRVENLTADMLNPEEILVLEEGHCFRDQALAICSTTLAGKRLNFEYDSGSIEALKGLVEKKLGYTLVPELSVGNRAGSVSAKRFSEPEPVREVSIVVHNSFTKEALIDRLHKSILEAIPDQFKKMKHYTRVKWR
ncbi:LysR substrate-binding domain-containing protein [Saccharicrinis sp. FJH2]|uniref:LysR substrate-binding domain-containing protein n=1 Tax=Saccharicrinis sp. FJH65 TaxID=3344659 RepID=UPI0035F30755